MSAAQKSESPLAGGQVAKQITGTTIVTPAENLGKRFATLQARCALAGVSLHQLENDRGNVVYIVSRWALTRELADLDAVANWLDRVTGVQS